MSATHTNQRKKMMFERHLAERYALKQQDKLKTAFLEEMGISVLCSLSGSGDDGDQVDKKYIPIVKNQIKRRTSKKKPCKWPHAMLASFIDLAKISEKSRRDKIELSSSSSYVHSLSDFDAETEREHESETDTDTDCIEMDLDTLGSEKSQ